MPELKNQKHEAFAVAVAKGDGMAETYARLYGKDPKKKSVQGNASRLGSSEVVRARIDELKGEGATEAVLNIRDVLLQLKKLIFFDPRDFFNKDGSPKDISKLSDECAAALSGFEVMEVWADRKFVGYVKKYKLLNRTDAIEKAMRHLGAFKETDPSKETNNLTFVQIVMNAEKALDEHRKLNPD